MRKIYTKILPIVFLALGLLGCEDFLNEYPVSEISTKSFFKDQAQFEQAVNGAYSGLRELAGANDVGFNGIFWIAGEMRSDNTTFQHNTTDQSGHRFWHVDQFIMNPNNEIVNQPWNTCYVGIGKCNTVIKYSEGIEFDKKAQFLAEVKFLRALYYYTLVRVFGDVPLITEPATSYNSAFEGNKRVSKDLVFQTILSDLNDAKQNLPKNYSASEFGRATEGAARTLLADVQMWLGKYNEAKTELEAVVAGNQYAVLDDYASVFDLNNEQNKEIVFSVQFIVGTFGLGSANMYTFLPWNSGTKYISHGQVLARTGMNIPTEDLINSFEEGDKRKDMIDFGFIDNDFGTYQGNIVPFTKKFWDPGHAVQYITGNDFPLYRYPHVLLMLAECYLREGGGDPVPLVNQVRRRAGLSNLTSVTLDDIIQERRVEFHCEADRWWVLVRTGKAQEVMLAHGTREKANRSGSGAISSSAFNKINILFPIPSWVLENDPTMEQNPEYE